MAEFPPDKTIEEEEEVQADKADPAQTTEEEVQAEEDDSTEKTIVRLLELNLEVKESSDKVYQSPQEESITIPRGDQTMTRGSTSLSSHQNHLLVPPNRSEIRRSQEMVPHVGLGASLVTLPLYQHQITWTDKTMNQQQPFTIPNPFHNYAPWKHHQQQIVPVSQQIARNAVPGVAPMRPMMQQEQVVPNVVPVVAPMRPMMQQEQIVPNAVRGVAPMRPMMQQEQIV